MTSFPSPASIRGSRELDRALQSLVASASNPGGALHLVGQRMRRMQMTHFEKEQDSSGRAWPELSPAYARQRMKRVERARRRRRVIPRAPMASPLPLLRRDGYLMNSIKVKVSVKGRYVLVGTNKIYARTHQFGDASRGIPQREFLYITEAEGGELADLMFDQVIRRALR